MLAIEATEEEARAGLVDLAGRVSLAAVNGPKAIVVSGEKRAIKRLARERRERGRRTKRLRVSHAFHSQLMEPMLEAFGEVVGGLRLSTPRIPIVSNVTGGVVGEELCAPDYWVRHVRETVRFAEGIGSLEAAGVRSFLELGPDGALCAAARESLDADARERALLVPALRARYPEAEAFMEFLARAHVVGVQVDWDASFAGRAARRVDLPSYAFQRKRYWLERHADAGGHAGQAAASADLRRPWTGSGRCAAGAGEPCGGVVGALGACWRRLAGAAPDGCAPAGVGRARAGACAQPAGGGVRDTSPPPRSIPDAHSRSWARLAGRGSSAQPPDGRDRLAVAGDACVRPPERGRGRGVLVRAGGWRRIRRGRVARGGEKGRRGFG